MVVDSARRWGDDSRDFLIKVATMRTDVQRFAQLNNITLDEENDGVTVSQLVARRLRNHNCVPPASFLRDLETFPMQQVRGTVQVLEGDDMPAILVMNKVDLVDPERAKHKARLIGASGLFERVVFLSAWKNKRIDPLRDMLLSSTVDQPWTYAPDQVSEWQCPLLRRIIL